MSFPTLTWQEPTTTDDQFVDTVDNTRIIWLPNIDPFIAALVFPDETEEGPDDEDVDEDPKLLYPGDDEELVKTTRRAIKHGERRRRRS